MEKTDVLIIGGGIVGLATAMALVERRDLSVTVIEAESDVARHQTGHNSGVIHSGLYYKPGSEKARNCAVGRELMYEFCREHHIPHDRCGKIVVATEADEVKALDDLERRGRANGLHDMVRLSGETLKNYEPHVAGIEGLFIRETGIVNYTTVCRKYVEIIEAAGGAVKPSHRFLRAKTVATGLEADTSAGSIACKLLVNCAGLQSDRVARQCGVEPGVQIVPFRGEYYELVPNRTHLVKNLIYPVPNPNLPFLGVHFTRMIGGGVECGPNAVLAFRREGYRFRDASVSDMLEYARYGGFWRMAAKFWKTGLGEMHRSLSKTAFWKSLRRLVPELRIEDIQSAGAGVRAQAVEPSGKLVDDFFIRQAPRMIHVLNAPSPAATASISIGQSLAEMARKELAT